MLARIHRHTKENSPHKIDIQKHEEFQTLYTLLANVYRKLHSEGIGNSKKQSSIITPEVEEQLWVTGTLNSYSPKGLLNAVFI
jgi:hypothetical protein